MEPLTEGLGLSPQQALSRLLSVNRVPLTGYSVGRLCPVTCWAPFLLGHSWRPGVTLLQVPGLFLDCVALSLCSLFPHYTGETTTSLYFTNTQWKKPTSYKYIYPIYYVLLLHITHYICCFAKICRRSYVYISQCSWIYTLSQFICPSFKQNNKKTNSCSNYDTLSTGSPLKLVLGAPSLLWTFKKHDCSLTIKTCSRSVNDHVRSPGFFRHGTVLETEIWGLEHTQSLRWTGVMLLKARWV